MTMAETLKKTINLKTLFGVEIPSKNLTRKIGREIIKQIQLRTENGFDVADKKFTKYSAKWADRKGVGRGDVDLLLTGSMLGNMILTNVTKNTVTIGWAGQKNNNKAFNHNEGDTVPQREFLSVELFRRICALPAEPTSLAANLLGRLQFVGTGSPDDC